MHHYSVSGNMKPYKKKGEERRKGKENNGEEIANRGRELTKVDK